MRFTNAFRVCGMAVAAGAVVLAAAPAGLAGTAAASAPAGGKVINLAQLAAQRDGASAKVAGNCSEGGLASIGAGFLRVTAELKYEGDTNNVLRARSGSTGDWEKFRICNEGKYWTIYSLAAKRYVTAEMGYTGRFTGLLRARGLNVNDWEKFWVDCTQSYCTIKSLFNNKYVSAEVGYTGADYGMLRARSTTVSDWEKFQAA
ncbi:hypothetical protein ABZU32_16165 [Sphaerisporangium sp. NPDC005288]|uniref:fascin domain-containing protein n=1 Tax=Sphaerisporangium sp. NPDC005288 TaxID=3155114 RepID=UPI0033B835AD